VNHEQPEHALGTHEERRPRSFIASVQPGLSRARTRLGADPLHMLFDEVAGPVGALDAAGVCCGGLRVVSMDGSSTDVPDTKDNDEYFGRPSNATRAGAFPQVRWVVAAESGTGALVGAAIGAYTVGEQTLARDLLGAFGPGTLVLADRNLLCHTLARDVLATGAHMLWRASASFRLTPIAVLAARGIGCCVGGRSATPSAAVTLTNCRRVAPSDSGRPGR
jgi:hypothetical protein